GGSRLAGAGRVPAAADAGADPRPARRLRGGGRPVPRGGYRGLGTRSAHRPAGAVPGRTVGAPGAGVSALPGLPALTTPYQAPRCSGTRAMTGRQATSSTAKATNTLACSSPGDAD